MSHIGMQRLSLFLRAKFDTNSLITVEKLCLFISGNFVHIVIIAVNIVVIWTKKISVLLALNAQCNYVKIT